MPSSKAIRPTSLIVTSSLGTPTWNTENAGRHWTQHVRVSKQMELESASNMCETRIWVVRWNTSSKGANGHFPEQTSSDWPSWRSRSRCTGWGRQCPPNDQYDQYRSIKNFCLLFLQSSCSSCLPVVYCRCIEYKKKNGFCLRELRCLCFSFFSFSLLFVLFFVCFREAGQKTTSGID